MAIDSSRAEAWYSLGLARQDDADHRGAAQAYAEALRLRPGFQEAALNLGIALQEQGRLEEALDAYGTALRQHPEGFGRIAQALVSGRVGVLWLDLEALRRHLVGRGG